MLKNPASGVLASLRSSTYRSVRLASSLAAALLDGLFEHPAATLRQSSNIISRRRIARKSSFSAACWHICYFRP